MASQLARPVVNPIFSPNNDPETLERPGTAALISLLQLREHAEGGYFVETDRDERQVVNPFHPSYTQTLATDEVQHQHIFSQVASADTVPLTDFTRSASTSIYFLLTESRNKGCFVRNRGRTIHTLHKGRARYVVIHANEVGKGGQEGCWCMEKARIETFVVGQDIARGERMQWVVEGDKYKASFLLPDEEGESESKEGCLITETVTPGWEITENDFLTSQRLHELVTPEQALQLAWLLGQR
ncbi:hypothetical protein AAF712_009020 [Marasmius tenuissimus]|uniref:DUF985 domain-containing protein n=1 Tax=Marasmius tenuissimus TaxID=585030 RepID=A0ABR2ZSB1_9AGAR